MERLRAATPPQAAPQAASGEDSDALDGELLARIREGDPLAAADVYRRYADRLRRLAQARCSAELASRIEPDDVVQSVFRRFFSNASRGVYDVPGEAALWQLLMVIALNKIRDQAEFHRAAKRDVRRVQRLDTNGTEALEAACHDEIEVLSLRLAIEEIVEAMPEPLRPILILRLEGHEVQEIAEQVGRSKRSVERVIQQFRNKLLLTLKQECLHGAQ